MHVYGEAYIFLIYHKRGKINDRNWRKNDEIMQDCRRIRPMMKEDVGTKKEGWKKLWKKECAEIKNQ